MVSFSEEDMKNKDKGIQNVEIANEILTVLFFLYQVHSIPRLWTSVVPSAFRHFLIS